MNKVYAASIKRAKKLYDGFNDVIHDWEHSRRVAENARAIAEQVGFDDVDFLELCAYWHDTARTRGIIEGHEEAGAVMAREDLLSHGASTQITNAAYTAIRFHKSSSKPTTTAGKIIRDADKLDIFCVTRWEKCAKAGWIKEYTDDFNKTVASHQKYPDTFTYEYTKAQFKKRLPAFLDYYKQVKDTFPC